MSTTSTTFGMLLNAPYFTGASSTQSVPQLYPCAINGRGYIIDTSFSPYRREAFRHRTIDMLRSQADTSNQPGEQSLNPEGLWRRTQETWHLGAGQAFLDRGDSDSARFRTSKGIDVWTKWQMSLLSDTSLLVASANTNVALVSVGTRLYAIDGQALVYSTTAAGLASPSTVTGTPAATATSVCSDGFNVYVAYTASGLYSTTRTGTSAAQVVSTALSTNSVCRYVKGRLIVSKDNSVYNVTSAGPAALPTALLTHANSDFVWVDFAEGPANIYLAGFSGDKSLVYRTTIKSDGTALDVPQVAGELPDGEIVRSIQGYLGYLLVGSDLGARFCTIDANGNLVLGDLIPTASAVKCFEPQDRFVWYGLTNYDTTSTGLGRMDLRNINGSAPAYASDLMATTQGAVNSVVTFAAQRVFAVSGIGFYGTSANKVASGSIQSGYITFGIADKKVAVDLHMDHLSLVGSYSSYLAQDGGTYNLDGTNTTAMSVGATYPTDNTLTDHFEVQQLLNRSATDTTTGPTLSRWTLRANPAAQTGVNLIIPIRLHEEMDVGGIEIPLVPSTEISLLDELRLNRRVIIYQEGNQSFTVTVEGYDWVPDSFGRLNGEANGVCIVTLKTLT